MSLSTTGLILLNLISTSLHHLMKRRVNGLALLTTKVTVSPGGSSLRILKRSSFVLVSEVPSELRPTSVLHHLQGRGPHFLFPSLILKNLKILCHLTLLMDQPPILSNLSKVSLVKMKIIQSPWPTLTFPIFLADPSFYHLRIIGSATWPKSLTLMTIDTFLTKIPIAPCYCQMMGRTLKEEIKITQYNNPTKAGKYSLEDLFRASDNIPHHYPKF